MILHIPHSSTELPKDFLVSNETDLAQEFQRMTNWYIEEIFDLPDALKIVFSLSRLYCDVERFRDDKDEIMAQKGMGICYEKNSFGELLREVSDDEKEFIKSNFYDKHHSDFTKIVAHALNSNQKAFIVDCHSFSNEVLLHEMSQSRPDFCIGTDVFHTPNNITEFIKKYLSNAGFSVAVNEPFEGTIVPLKYYRTNKNVSSVMIEINRKLYLNEHFQKNEQFENVKKIVSELLNLIKENHE